MKFKQTDSVPHTTNEKWRSTVVGWLAQFPSQNTRGVYLWAWSDFMRFVEVEPDKVTAEQFASWMSSQEAEGKSRSTLYGRKAAIRSYFEYLRGVGIREDNPTRPPQADVSLPEISGYEGPLSSWGAIAMSEELAKNLEKSGSVVDEP